MKTLSTLCNQASRFLKGAAAVALLAIGAQTASAHSFTITATSTCSAGAAVVTFTATSWEGPNAGPTDNPSADNGAVNILFNGTIVFTGAFTLANGDMFTMTEPAPATAMVTVTGYVSDDWGDGFAAGSTSPGSMANPATFGPIPVATGCTPPPPTGTGCTPGFYKNNADHKGANHWVGFTPSETLAAAGFVIPSTFADGSRVSSATTLLAALSFGGGSSLAGAAEILLRAAVAAVLNADNFGGSASAIIAAVNTALASNDRNTILNLASMLDAANNGNCTLSN